MMRESGTIVFVEVRMRRHGRFGSAAESIDSGKLRRVRLASELWLRRSGNGTAATRIDVVTLDGTDTGTARIAWLRGIDA